MSYEREGADLTFSFLNIIIIFVDITVAPNLLVQPQWLQFTILLSPEKKVQLIFSEYIDEVIIITILLKLKESAVFHISLRLMPCHKLASITLSHFFF